MRAGACASPSSTRLVGNGTFMPLAQVEPVDGGRWPTAAADCP